MGNIDLDIGNIDLDTGNIDLDTGNNYNLYNYISNFCIRILQWVGGNQYCKQKNIYPGRYIFPRKFKLKIF